MFTARITNLKVKGDNTFPKGAKVGDEITLQGQEVPGWALGKIEVTSDFTPDTDATEQLQNTGEDTLQTSDAQAAVAQPNSTATGHKQSGQTADAKKAELATAASKGAQANANKANK